MERKEKKMNRKPISINEYAGYILNAMKKGILLNTKNGETEDTMTIGWGQIGIDWSLPVFTVYVRESRFTRQLLDASGEFTISVPLQGQDVRKILSVCGTESGRDVDKFEKLGLHRIPGNLVSSPALAELPLTVECRVLYRQEQNPESIPASLIRKHYPNGDFHTAYIGQIVDAYILEKPFDESGS